MNSNLATWRDLLADEAARLDLSDSEDRALFRAAVSLRARRTRVDLLRALAADLGAERVPTSKAGAVRALADAYIGRQA